ncbi:hypothetical protein AB4369_28190, partial [Vibrio sp. 10N.261.49.A5]
GLAISKGIAHVLGHQISMRSWPGEGSVFSITLARAEQVAPVVQASTPMATSDIEHLKILCVDNEREILVGMENLIGRWGCEVKTAVDLVESLKCLDDDWQPDVIFSDYRL